ncbi:uncharacterized protein LOC101861348 [Aplysia californica]|uniref:Uncharacterized protein LOC101861348 n=1 Tax=Aplysia californica TaxID=6500 RepID=A0ABM0JIR0_APLCA|nr:uncharacterized protein LOC101861348 [Aplysia californica]
MSALRTVVVISHHLCPVRHAIIRSQTLHRSSLSTFVKWLPAGSSSQYRLSSSSANSRPTNLNLFEDACPQGIQGDDCDNFKLWLESCRRYGLANCEEQLQGIQTGRKTLAEVLAEQDKLIAEIAQKYRAAQKNDQTGNAQGIQPEFSAFPKVDEPCPQGIQGDDCVRFKLWLENCYRFGLQDCMDQYQGVKAGRKTLQQIFDEQDKTIRAAASTVFQQHRKYSTASSSSSSPKGPADEDPGKDSTPDLSQLTQRQKLQRAVKEYGSTVIVFHVGISLMSLGFFYALVSSGVDVVRILQAVGIGEAIIQNKLATGTGTFVMAYAVHKVFAPVRIATTLTATPFIVRYLRRIGFLKAPKVKSKQ